MNVILGLGVIFLAGLLFAKVINKVKLPSITAYLLLGILLGPSVLGFIPSALLEASGTISNIVLGVIAFSIGQNFQREHFRRIGKTVVWISVLEATGAFVLVTAIFYFVLKQPFYLALLFGAISSATAPAATVMVIREYRSKGNFTDTLLGVVAIDDAWCLIIFAVALALAKAIYEHIVSSLLHVFFNSLLTIAGAFVLGALVAMVLTYCVRFIRTPTEMLIFTLGFVLLNTGIAIRLELSVLLANMFLGAILVNMNNISSKYFESLRSVDTMLFLLFFVLAGANLEIGLLSHVGIIGGTYIIVRVIGKMFGAGLGAHISGATKTVKKFLALGLVPQAGVALGCALIAKTAFPAFGNIIFTTIVTTDVVYELIGPICTKFALNKAGEIPTESRQDASAVSSTSSSAS